MSQSETKQCQSCKQNFTVESEDFDFYAKIKVPAPTWCPECRMVRRMQWRNERTLYKRKCDAPGHNEEIISIYHKDSPVKVYDQKYWWSDEWDPMSYSKDYDFNKPFFEQWNEFRNNFPLMSVSNSNAINSDYCNVADQSKNCYLISAAFQSEDVMYSNRIAFCKNSLDLYIASENEFSYENILSGKTYKTFFNIKTENCIDSYFLYDCKNCQNCFGCSNLRNKQYYIFNKPYTKEEYFKKLQEYNIGSYQNLQKIKSLFFDEICKKAINKYSNALRSIDFSGDNLGEAKNCKTCFDIKGVEDCKYVSWGGYNLKDTYDGGPGIGAGGELLYEAFDTGIQGSRNFFTSVVYGSHNIQYSFNCHNSSNLFACIGLRNKQYCILNKQYSKEEYEQLVPKIIEHMNDMPYTDKKGRVYKYGEFFPPELSPFAYNETIAQEYFPLTKEQAIEQGYNWKDSEERNISIDIKSEDLPDHIKDVSDDILNKVIECGCEGHGNEHPAPEQAPVVREISTTGQARCGAGCTTAFKIIKPELDFYRKMNLPLPRLCPNCRHYQRLKQRNPLKLWKRQCMCNGKQSDPSTSSGQVYQNTITHQHGTEPCSNTFETTYSPDRPEIVYCEKCYNGEVV